VTETTKPDPPEAPQDPEQGRDPRADTDSVRAVSAAHQDELLDSFDGDDGSLDEFDLESLRRELEAQQDTDELLLPDPSVDDTGEHSATDQPPPPSEPVGAPAPGEAAPPTTPSESQTYGDIVWGQFRKNRLAVAALWCLGLLVLAAVVSPLISSDRPFIWVDEGERTWPWFRSLFDVNLYENPVDIFFNLLMAAGIPLLLGWLLRGKLLAKKPLTRRARRRKLRNEGLALAALLLLGYAALLAFPSSDRYVLYPELLEQAEVDGRQVTAVFPPSTISPRQTGFESAAPPSREHVLGTDQSTRDVAVRILYGTRVSLTIGVIAVSIYVFIGILLGAIAGFFGGWIDVVLQRLIEIMMSVPSFFVILTIMAFLDDRSIFHIMIVLGLIRWTTVARLVRGEFLRLRNLEFVTAAEALGFPRHRIIFSHILPNALGPVLVAATFGVAACILIEASLSFLGLGDISAPSWGQMIQEGYATGAWHLILAPGFAIFATVSALNLVGEGLRDALDPRLRQ
jgi:peptide/nickel transport system permease protein